MARKKSVPAEWVRNPSDELAIGQGCTFDATEGEKPCKFIEEYCRQSKGKWAGKPIKLLDWQRDFLMRLFGWRLPDGRRRFRRFYVEVPKKNGKTTLLAALQLDLLICDDNGPEIYINACSIKQASMMFDESARMVRASPELKRLTQVVDYQKRIVYPGRNGVIRANSSEAPSQDGLNPSATLFDELHRQPDRKLWEVFEYAGAAREEPILGSITTAGEAEDGVWFEQREYSEKVNKGDIPDITHLGIIYRVLPGEDVDDPAVWRRVNPSMGVTIREDDFARELCEAKQSPVQFANFKRLRLGIIARETGLFLAPEQWAACGPPDGKPARLDLAKFRGRPCYLGGDLSSVSDLTALCAVWPDDDGSYDAAWWFYLPKDDVLALERRDRMPYRSLAEQGWLTLTPGPAVDYEFLRREANGIATDHDLRKFFIDPFNATQIGTQMAEADGLPVVMFRQGFLSLNAPTKELQRLILGRKFRHHNNPLARWMAGNAVAETDAAGCIKLNKPKSRLKIDGMSALVNAIGAAMGDEDGGDSVYETRGILVV